ncbi:valine--tRNA ligase [Sneathiella chungangensis]|uniref:Valine--tRNA ligase n=1 Tax=Sneathiella chungangensis TaxID=1418234 RepID=A0A845MCA5_9PROT|nr:valine--tRNA ligase [Sneathiella chungangensis]MZR21312.1 valine--tRNA ligase [Sneathiella chungangensis]
MLDKSYRPDEVEGKLYSKWMEQGAFACGRAKSDDTYTIVIPPPNVTGSLHMGHALNNTLQDVLIRFERMRGKDVLWQPGMDHAGIATQMVVERQLGEQGKTRHDFGREKFIDKVWEWKDQSGGQIFQQLQRLGATCDWDRERFTMDEGLSKAVRKVFVQLYKEGLIYRDKRLVNWDPKFHTAISDLEVEQKEVNGHMWHFRYPVEGEEGRSITVATTRPETMLGDTGIAVHPEDERYTDLVGKFAILPIVGRRIPIVADDYADPEQGSGAVKITPAHDFNDFEVGKRAGLEVINIMDENAHLNDAVPEEYQGMERFEARKKVVAEMESLGLLEKIDDHPHTVPYGDRSGVVIEPLLTDQWFADAATLAQPAIRAVENGKTKFVPEKWTNTYYDWMRNIQPWCISRQLWWGHRIPAWFGPDGMIFVEETEEEALAAAEAHYGRKEELAQDNDVLDTWFSSALWPFSTLGWPDKTPELARYYPTDTLVTGFDIIFFWVARMMMMGLHFMEEVPFHTVYIHALVRDEQGAKMSKSKGNVVDPLDLMDKYGADALRFFLSTSAAQGRDVRLSEQRVEGYRNFATKLWNAARFCEMNDCAVPEGFDPFAVKETINQWIVGETVKCESAVRAAIEGYRFNDASNAIYAFTWNVFCDWYLEFAKLPFQGNDKAETQATAAWVLDQILKILHPFMPFVTEELWGSVAATRKSDLIVADWPVYPADADFAAATAEMDWVQELITSIRGVRSEMNVPAGAKIPLIFNDGSAEDKARLEKHWDIIARMARLESYATDAEVPKGALQFVHKGATVILPLAGAMDLDAEKARLQKEIGKLSGYMTGLNKKLGNEKFVANAPADVVAGEKAKLADAETQLAKLKDAAARLAEL